MSRYKQLGGLEPVARLGVPLRYKASKPRYWGLRLTLCYDVDNGDNVDNVESLESILILIILLVWVAYLSLDNREEA